jgi:hypothetical protein
MKHYIQIELLEPPKGATHFNPSHSLSFEKREGSNISVWDNENWIPVNSKVIRKGSYPIISS